MNETTQEKKRPTSITVICIIGFIGVLFTVLLIVSPMAQRIGSWYPPYLTFAGIIGFACIVGLWMMKKWAAYTYTGLVVLNQIVLITMGVWNIMALLIPAVVIYFALKNISRMT